MFHLELKFVDSLEVRLVIQVIAFLIALIVTQMVWREYRRNKNDDFLKYLLASFAILFVQSAFMLAVFVYSQVTGNKLPEVFMPMVDHILKVLGYLFLSYAFVFVANVNHNRVKKFFSVNITALVLVTPVFWYFWYQYLLTAPLVRQKFGHFYIDPIYEIWSTALLLLGLYLVTTSFAKMKKTFILAFFIIILKQLMHIVNLTLSNNTIPEMLVIERLLLVPYFYVIIMAIHREIVDEIRDVNSEKENLNQQLYDSTIQALVSSLEIKDPYTKGHAKRVTEYALGIGRLLGLSGDELRDLYFGAILHDIGKIGVHEQILNKPGSLDHEEMVLVHNHSYDGTTVIDGLANLRHIVPAIRHHHERWDGQGYPDKLRGEEIPLHARIIAVVDAFDAMTSDRAYRQALPYDKVIKELRDGRGKQFDSRIVDVFLGFLQEQPRYNISEEVAVSRDEKK